jgi:hypothetical protein
MPSLVKTSPVRASLVESSLIKLGLIRIVLGAGAVSMTLGAVQFASGHDLAAPLSFGKVGNTVNRTDKTDRAVIAAPGTRTQTIAFRPGDLPGTSVLVRIPVTREARQAVPPPFVVPMKSGQNKPMVACEPVVSVLTEVARRLQPGRCVA